MAYRKPLATTRVQDTAEVLITDHKPMTTDVMSLFKDKQKFMSAAFDKVFQADRSKKHEKEHERYFNNQSANEKLSTFCTKSTKARSNVSDILSHITSAKI